MKSPVAILPAPLALGLGSLALGLGSLALGLGSPGDPASARLQQPAGGPEPAPEVDGEASPSQPRSLGLGDHYEGVLGSEAIALVLDLAPDERATLQLDSLAFDPVLTLTNEEGSERTFGDGTLGIGVRLYFEAMDGPLTLSVDAKHGGTGPFVLSVAAGHVGFGEERWLPLVDRVRAVVDWARVHGDEERELRARVHLVRLEDALDRIDASRAQLAVARRLSLERGDRAETERLSLHLAFRAAILGDLEAARRELGGLPASLSPLAPGAQASPKDELLLGLLPAAVAWLEARATGARPPLPPASTRVLLQEILEKRAAHHRQRHELRDELRAQELHLELLPDSGRIALLGRSGHSLQALGRHAEALAAFEEALRLQGGDDPDLRYERARTLMLLGRFHEARDGLETLLEEPATGADLRCRVLNELGLAEQRLGDEGAALERQEQALALALDLGLGDTLEEVRLNLASLALEQGALERARNGIEAVLARAEDPALRLAALGNLAWLEWEDGNLERARTLGDRALRGWRERGEPERILEALDTLARVALDQREGDTLQALLLEAESLLEHQNLDQLGPEGRARWRARHAGLGELAQAHAALRLSACRAEERADLVLESWRALGRWKGRALLEGILEGDAPSGGRGATADRGQADRVARLERELAALRRRTALDEHEQRLVANLPGPKAELLEAQLRAARARSGAHSEAGLGLDPEALSASLSPGGVLVEFAQGVERLYAYRYDGSSPEFADLGTRAELEPLLAELVAALRDPRSPLELLERRAVQLYDALLRPLVGDLDGVETLVVAPAAILSGLAFEALAPAPGQVVIDRTPVAYAPSASVLAAQAPMSERADPAHLAQEARFLILADPTYEERERLPGTRTEALATANLLLGLAGERERYGAELLQVSADREGALETERFDLYLGSSSHAGRLFEPRQPYDVVHVGAHARVDADPRRTQLELADSPGFGGALDLPELVALELATHLTVLTACDSAAGAVLPGEGVQSLARAFHRAGSRAVVASLWSLEDEQVAGLTRAFYEHLLGGAHPAEALARAKTESRRRGVGLAGSAPRPHPYFWAALIYSGPVAGLGASED